jgi:uncharacterized protein
MSKNLSETNMQNIPKWLIQAIAGLVAIVLLVVIIDRLTAISNAQRSYQNTITITAEGKVNAVPDLATINASVITKGSTAEKAQTDSSKKMDAVMKYIEDQGVEKKDIQTSGYNVYPEYDYNQPGQVITGYVANQTVTIKVRNHDLVGKLLGGLTANGVNQIMGVSYSFDDPDDLKQQAREEALKNAREKAEKLADAAGVRLGKLVSFSENSVSGGPIPYPMFDKGVNLGMGMGGSTAAVPERAIEPGTQDLVAQVSVVFEIK